MYRWIWRQLPVNPALRTVVLVALIAAVLALLVFGLFPYVDAHLPVSQVTVGS